MAMIHICDNDAIHGGIIGDNDSDDDNCSSWGNDPEMEAASKDHAFCDSKPSPSLRWTLLLWKWALIWTMQPWILLRRTPQSMNFEMSIATNQNTIQLTRIAFPLVPEWGKLWGN